LHLRISAFGLLRRESVDDQETSCMRAIAR